MDNFECPSFEHIVLVNRTLVARYGGAGHHVLNGGPLHNAIALVNGPVFGQDQFPTLAEKACKVAFAIATGHVFTDANKRTAASVLDLILNLNGCILQVVDDELVSKMYALADSRLSFAELLDWVAPNVSCP